MARGKRGEAGRQLPRADSCPLSLLPLLASRENVMTGCQQPLWARRSPCSGSPTPARTRQRPREMEAASAGAKPGARPAWGQAQHTARLCGPSVPDTLWTKQNWLASERKISQSSPLREKQTTGRPPSHNGQGGRVSKAFCCPAGLRARPALHRPLAGVDGEPSSPWASTSGEAGHAGRVSFSTVNDEGLNSTCLEDALPAACAACRALPGTGSWG